MAKKLIDIMNEMDRLENEIEKKNCEYMRQEEKDFNGFMLNTIKEWEKLFKLRIEYLKICNFTLEDKPDYGNYFSFEEFKECCKQGLFIDSDGVGHFCVGDKMTDLQCYPSYVLDDNFDTLRFDGVMWFNK